KMVGRSIENAISYGVSRRIAERNIQIKDTLSEFPNFLIENRNKVYHITNPPYLYIGYIAKHKENQGQLRYFTGVNSGLQDLYQLALMNDLRNGIEQMVYIIPSNFLFGHSVSNLIRRSFLKNYVITDAIIFRKKVSLKIQGST
ncbi:methyltransferase, partial [mine drainage metagenome]